MAKEKKPAPEKVPDEKLMARIMKPEEPCTYMGKPAVLVPLLWNEDLVVSSMLSDFVSTAKANGVGAEAIEEGRRILVIATTIRFTLKHDVIPEGRIHPERAFVFKDMDEVKRASKNEQQWAEIIKLYALHCEAFNLTESEKKS